MRHPMQPIYRADDGCIVFQKNEIIDYLWTSGKLSLNEIACMKFSKDDRMQVAQLLGYSVSGFGDLSYADPEVVALADKEASKL